MTKLKMRFCDYIRQKRENMGLAQKEIAEVLCVDVPMYSRYERGLRSPKEEHISIIASKLDLDCTELRKMWVAEKVMSVVNDDEDATDILNMVANNINQNRSKENGY